MSFGPRFSFERGALHGPAMLPVMIAAGVGGAALTGISSYDAAQARANNASYQAQVAANNAKIAMQNAAMDTQEGEIAAGNYGMKVRAEIGKTKAGQAASGVSVNSGSFVAARAAESELGMLDALTIRSNSAKKAYAQEVAATGDTAESTLLQTEASQTRAAAPVAALGSFLSSASAVGGNIGKLANVGGMPSLGGASGGGTTTTDELV